MEIINFLFKFVLAAAFAIVLIAPFVKATIKKKKAQEERKADMDYLAKKIVEEQKRTENHK